jgi:hypothetical protein
MGSKYYSPALKKFVNRKYKDAKADLYACFIQRNAAFAKENGFVGMITIPNWMFLSSFEAVRKTLFEHQTIDSFVHNGRGVFGSDFGSCSFVVRNANLRTYRGTFRRLFDKQGSVASNEDLVERFFTAQGHYVTSDEFAMIPGVPVAYWVGQGTRECFAINQPLGSVAPTRTGMRTGDNQRFLRLWHEVSIENIGFDMGSSQEAKQTGLKWFPYNKGGEFRKWYGNNYYLVNWQDDGREIKEETRRTYPDLGDRLGWKISNEECYFQPSITWTDISASCFGARMSDQGFIFDVSGSSAFPSHDDRFATISLLCSKVAFHFLLLLNPTVHFQIRDVATVPFLKDRISYHSCNRIGSQALRIAQEDWNASETSWRFTELRLLHYLSVATLRESHGAAETKCRARFNEMKELEEENNCLFINAYGLQNELSPDVPDDQITLCCPDRLEDTKRLLSYATGCMMGRYSLDKPGLIYAHASNTGFDPSQYKTFPADEDGILPLTELGWGFKDDTARRMEEFVGVAWSREHLAENLKFIADSLGPANNEQPRDTIRRYLATGFYKDHLRWYKRRPIYWLFSSGKQRAFQCLVYLHRYHEGTLARMRTEYVIPLQGKIAARIEQLEGDKAKATSTSHRRKVQKEQDDLRKQQAELFAFDEKLKHYADMRIKLDLDDGVKVNYGKFGDLLAEVKAVTGGKDDD